LPGNEGGVEVRQVGPGLAEATVDLHVTRGNTYAHLGEAGYVYVSDSDGYWHFHSLTAVLAENTGVNVHVLTPPPIVDA
jgi:hypothetical protein